LDSINELEILLKSSECKLIQFQTMLREAKQEKKDLREKLELAETHLSVKDELLLEEKLKVSRSAIIKSAILCSIEIIWRKLF